MFVGYSRRSDRRRGDDYFFFDGFGFSLELDCGMGIGVFRFLLIVFRRNGLFFSSLVLNSDELYFLISGGMFFF